MSGRGGSIPRTEKLLQHRLWRARLYAAVAEPEPGAEGDASVAADRNARAVRDCVRASGRTVADGGAGDRLDWLVAAGEADTRTVGQTRPDPAGSALLQLVPG